MGISLAKIAANTASVTFSVGEDTVTIEYYPSRITEKTYSQLQAVDGLNTSNIPESFAALNDALASLIKSWDVYEDEAQTMLFPIEAARFPELPVQFRMQLLQAVLGDIRPN